MKKKLYRSAENQMLGGVCGGIAEYFDIDPIIVRILCVIGILTGVGAKILILGYFIGMGIIPMKYTKCKKMETKSEESDPVEEV